MQKNTLTFYLFSFG